MSSMQVLAELASVSLSETASVAAQINTMIENQRSTTKKVTEKSGCSDESNAGQVPMKEYISNPPLKKKQSQARKQPMAIGAPTTTSYKAAGNRSQRERKQTEKATTARALGLM